MATVLIIEDDPLLAECYQRWLGADGHTARHAPNAQMALDMLDEEHPRAIVLDLLLPGANGLQVLHTLQSHEDLAVIPVIVCSNALPESPPDFALYGVRAVLDKSMLTRRTLQNAVRGVL